MKQLLAIGKIYVDINCPRFPFDKQGIGIESEPAGETYDLALGGSAANFARLCQRLGLGAHFIGKCGDDTMGHLLPDLLRGADIVDNLIIDPHVTTDLSINLINADGEAIMMIAGSAGKKTTPKEVIDQARPLLAQLDYLYFGSCLKLHHLLPAFRELAHAAGPKSKVIIDHGRIPEACSSALMEDIRQLVAEADYYFPSEAEFMQLWDADSIEEGLRKVAMTSDALTIVKHGSAGAFMLQDDSIVHVPAFSVQAHNTVGAGDSFNAGFIAAIEQGFDVVAAMRYACAVAALKISQTDLPDSDQVADFLAKQT